VTVPNMAVEGLEIHDTGDEKQYRFLPFNGHTLRFHVKAAHDCHIAFTEGDGESTPMIEVFIGAWEGACSAVRFNQEGEVVKVDTEGILSEDEFREFWITKDHDTVRVGKGGEFDPFMEGTLPECVAATHFAYTTGWGATGQFQFLHERELATEDKLEYVFEPLYGQTASFSVSCGHDAHIAFTTAPEMPEDGTNVYEVFLGGWENQSSAIRKNREVTTVKVDTPDECCDSPKGYWVDVLDGHIKVGRHGEADPFMSWDDPEPFRPTHFGYCTGWGACGQWKLDV